MRFADLSDVLYPIPLLKELKVNSTRKKIGLAVVFSLGLVTIIVSIGRFITTTFVSNDISICTSFPYPFCLII